MRMVRGKSLKIPRTPGAAATVQAYETRLSALASYADAMKYLQELGIAVQLIEKNTADFEARVNKAWATRLTQLRREHGKENTDDVVKLIKQGLAEFEKR